MEVRGRRPLDVEPCLALLHEVHELDGYPSTVADAAGFLFPPYEVASWVAVADSAVLGHVALHEPPGSATVETAREATGAAAAECVVLSRLFVAPVARGQGIARALLETALAEARARGQRAVLDVGQGFDGAVALYEAAGWSRIASERQWVGDEAFDVHVYLAPQQDPA